MWAIQLTHAHCNPNPSVASQAGQILALAADDEKVAVISSHPQIGANPAKGMSATSQKEQSSGGVDPTTMAKLGKLNSE